MDRVCEALHRCRELLMSSQPDRTATYNHNFPKRFNSSRVTGTYYYYYHIMIYVQGRS